jgi:hypothetical protein
MMTATPRFVVCRAGCFGGNVVFRTNDALAAVKRAKGEAPNNVTVRGLIRDLRTGNVWTFSRRNGRMQVFLDGESRSDELRSDPALRKGVV